MTPVHCPYCGFADVAPGTSQCPRCQTELGRGGVGDRPVTLVENSAADLRAALLRQPVRTPTKQESSVGHIVVNEGGTLLSRPTGRPPVALLVLLDDGERSGEEIRIRGERFVLGRTEGDVTIPHDSLISGKHVE